MKLKDFIKQVKFNNINDTTRDIKQSHPLQWVEEDLKVPIWKIEYKYKTNNENEKTHIKYIVKEENMDAGELEHYFKNHIEKYNKEYPHRALSDVEILDMQFIDGVILELE